MNILKPYEEYKYTELLWVDSIPKHWKVESNKSIWAERKTTNCINEQLLSVTIKKGVISQSDLLQSSSKKDSSNLDKSKYKLVMPNDIAYNKMRMWQGAVGVSKYRGIVSPAYIVLKARKDINHRYYHYLLRMPDYTEESHRYSYGICDDQLNLRYEDFKRMQNIIPPKEEQDQIVKYLDSKLLKINKFIKAKKRQIEFLKEQKQAIINQAVTKGLDPNAKMKPSGIEWLGNIPEHWDVGHNFQVFSERNEKNYSYMRLLSVTIRNGVLFQTEMLEENSVKRDSSNEDKSNYKRVLKGDIVYNKMRMWQGATGCSNYDGIVSPAYIIIKPLRRIFSWYYHYLYRTPMYNKYSYSQSYGICDDQLSLRYDQFKRMLILIPPIREQKEIVSYIKLKTGKIDKTIGIIQKEIDLITEYRTSVISNVVTGKVDVRNI